MPDLTSTTVTTSTLKVPIKLETGKEIYINLADPKDTLTKDDLVDASKETGFAGYIVNENMINYNGEGVEAVDVGDPYYYNTEKITFD